MLQLKKQITEKTLSGVYVFFGEERYLINVYLERIRHALLTEEEEFMNYSFAEAPAEESSVVEMMETLPFMAEHRLAVIKNSGYFKPGDDFTTILEALDRLDPATILIFDEKEVDKRSAMYKKVAKIGRAVEFSQLKPDALSKWIEIEAKQRGLNLSPAVSAFMVHYCGTDMTMLSSEIQKLLAYCAENAGKRLITQEDVRAVCTSNGVEKIFKLTDAMSEGKTASALTIYNDLISNGEKPNAIYAMICRQFRLLLRAKIMVREGSNALDIQQQLAVQDFVARNLMTQSARFSEETLRHALTELLQLDSDSKCGNIDISDACMTILLQYSQRNL